MVPPAPPAEEPIGLLAAAFRSSVRRLVASRIEPLGLSTQQAWFLVTVAEHPGQSQAEVAAWLRVDEATACRVVRGLAQHGWLATDRDPADRRRVRLALTPQGEKLTRAILPIVAQVRAAVDGALTPEERRVTRAALAKILRAVDALASAAPASATAPVPAARARRRA